MIAARQLLTWTDGRNASSFSALTWSGNTLSFSVGVGAGADRADRHAADGRARRPDADRDQPRRHPVTFTLMTVKGQEYAMFPAVGGAYQRRTAPCGGAGGRPRPGPQTYRRQRDRRMADRHAGSSTLLLGTSAHLLPTEVRGWPEEHRESTGHPR